VAKSGEDKRTLVIVSPCVIKGETYEGGQEVAASDLRPGTVVSLLRTGKAVVKGEKPKASTGKPKPGKKTSDDDNGKPAAGQKTDDGKTDDKK